MPPLLGSIIHAYRRARRPSREGMSEALRASLNRRFTKTISSFGASDLEINMAAETDFCIALRQELHKNAELAHDLYGGESIPMIFQCTQTL